MIRTDYKDGSKLDPRDLNEAFTVLKNMQSLLTGANALFKFNAKDVKVGTTVNVTPSDIAYNNSAEYSEGSLGEALKQLESNLNLVQHNPAKVTVFTSTKDLSTIQQHGIFYCDRVDSLSSPDGSGKCYLQVYKTGADFFFQICYTAFGNVYSRSYNNGTYSQWDQMKGTSAGSSNAENIAYVQNTTHTEGSVAAELAYLRREVTRLRNALYQANISIPE